MTNGHELGFKSKSASVENVFEYLLIDFSSESQSEFILSAKSGVFFSFIRLRRQQLLSPPEVIIAVKNVLIIGIKNDPNPITSRMGKM